MNTLNYFDLFLVLVNRFLDIETVSLDIDIETKA